MDNGKNRMIQSVNDSEIQLNSELQSFRPLIFWTGFEPGGSAGYIASQQIGEDHEVWLATNAGSRIKESLTFARMAEWYTQRT